MFAQQLPQGFVRLTALCTNVLGASGMDVEMEDVEAVSQYLQSARATNDDMEIDIDESRGLLSANILGQALFLVVDTNFMISNLDIVNDIVSYAPAGLFFIVVPSTVLAELDGLKLDSKVCLEARAANLWIHEQLAMGTPQVRGQRRLERLDVTARKDDAILDCCLWLHEHHGDDLVVLLSNDKNLCAKALVDDIKTISYQLGMTGVQIVDVVYQERLNQPVGSIRSQRQSVAPPDEGMSAPIPSFNGDFNQSLQTVYSEVLAVLTLAVTKAIAKEYGSIEAVPNFTPPTDLRTAGQSMCRFWFTVFQEYFDTDDPFKVGDGDLRKRDIRREPKFYTMPSSPGELLEFTKFWLDILRVVYGHVMDSQQNQALLMLLTRWKEMSR